MIKNPTHKHWLLAVAVSAFLAGCGPGKGDVESKMQKALAGECKVTVKTMEELKAEGDVSVNYSVNGNSVSVQAPTKTKRYVVTGEIEYLDDSHVTAIPAVNRDLLQDLNAVDAEIKKAEELNDALGALSMARDLWGYSGELSRNAKSSNNAKTHAGFFKEAAAKSNQLSALVRIMNDLRSRKEFQDKEWERAVEDAADCRDYTSIMPSSGVAGVSFDGKIEEVSSQIKKMRFTNLGDPFKSLPSPKVLVHKKGDVVPFKLRVAEVSSGGKSELRRDFENEGMLGGLGAAAQAMGQLFGTGSESDQWSSGFGVSKLEKGDIVLGSPEWKAILDKSLGSAKDNTERLEKANAEAKALLSKTLADMKSQVESANAKSATNFEKQKAEILAKMDASLERCKTLIKARKDSLPKYVVRQLGLDS